MVLKKISIYAMLIEKELMNKSLCAIFLICTLALPITNTQATSEVSTSDITISFSGDILTHQSLYKAALHNKVYNFDKFFVKIKPYLNSDIDICHLETPLVEGNPAGYPSFRTPKELAPALKNAGFEGCSLASNHSLDAGKSGVRQSIDYLAKQGLKHAGTSINNKEFADIAFYAVKNYQIAHLSYTWSTNGVKPSEKFLVNYPINSTKIFSDVAQLKQSGVDLVLLSLHFGNEYSVEISSYQKNLVDKLTKNKNIDAVIGHHAHVMQKALLVNNTPVAFGLGNLWSGQGPWSNNPRTQWGGILYLSFSTTEKIPSLTKVRFLPTTVIPGTWVITPSKSVVGKWSSQAKTSIKESSKLISPLSENFELL